MATTATTGTYKISDLQAVNDVSVLEFGESTVAEVLARDLERFNAQVQMMLAQLAQPVTTLAGRIGRYGNSIDTDMVELDELGRPPAKKSKPGVNVGFPLKKYGWAAGFTRDYIATRTPAEVVAMAVAAQKGYRKRIRKEIQRAIYLSANYTFNDRLVDADNIDLPVKRLVNADSAAIPDGPNGETFDGATHTHYNANNGWDNAAVLAAISDLTEHGHTDGVVMAINSADESAVRALADFEPYLDPRLTTNANTNEPRTRLDLSNTGDRAIGLLGQAEVWIKPWVLDNYPFIWAVNDPVKPLKFRQHHEAALRGFRLAFQLDDYPLRADMFEAYMGFGVWGRTNGVVLYTASGTYADPTIAR
jgi:hypothetical protein